MSKKYWLIKSEPNEFSWEDLKQCENETTCWDGVRNYQARNFMRDEMKTGDEVLFYHSGTEHLAIIGTCEVVKESYPDHTQFDIKDKHFDPKAKPGNPIWIMVDLKLKKELGNPVTLEQIKTNKNLKNMQLIRKGNRLSIMPVTKDEFNEIIKMSS